MTGTRARVVLAHWPGPNARARRSRLAACASTARASGPSSSSTTRPCETSITEWCRPASAASSWSESPVWFADLTTSHSSGPSQRISMSPLAATVFGSTGRATPSTPATADRNASAWASPRRLSNSGAGSARSTVGSAMAALSFGVIECGRRDGGLDGAARQRREDGLAYAGAAALHHGERERPADARAVVARGYVPQHRHRRPRQHGLHELCALGQHLLGVLGQQAHELLALGTEHRRALERAAADEVLARRD